MQVVSSGYYCECSAGAAYESDNLFNSTLKGCTACSGTQSPTPNQAFCKECGGTRNSSTGACSCSSLQDALLYFDTDGDYLSSMTCQTCNSDAYPTDNPHNMCQPLSTGMTYTSSTGSLGCSSGFTLVNNNCYSDIQHTILEKYPLSAAAQIIYTDETSTAKISVEITNSALVNTYWQLNLIECNNFRNTTACEIISNLCVLTLYNENLPPCSYMLSSEQTIAQEVNLYNLDWKLNLPWLEYSKIDNSTIIDTEYSFTSTSTLSNELEIYVAEYNFTGSLIHFEALTNQLSNCQIAMKSVENLKKFGNTYKIDCNLQMENYFETGKLEDARFYELYLYQSDSGNYTDIPVVIKNV